ncbi:MULTISPECIES: acyl carrier protein [Kordiimonas]|jgi:acyl carrier protein|uniref:acyl carrier protein n=1 Tax=Kordiimonas TaxID=288021 RepID=UPI00257DD933|nr:acyl carrier protein [Kordiimonas sp. UBA4487]
MRSKSTDVAINASAINIARSLVSQALKVSVDRLNGSVCMYDFSEWDSLGQLQIVQMLEKELDVTIEDEATFVSLSNFDAIVKFVEENITTTQRT